MPDRYVKLWFVAGSCLLSVIANDPFLVVTAAGSYHSKSPCHADALAHTSAHLARTHRAPVV
jgi:hypothetical protein